MTPEEIAAALVANGYAHRLPLSACRCEVTIEMKADPKAGWGRLYVKTNGDVRVGHTASADNDAGF